MDLFFSLLIERFVGIDILDVDIDTQRAEIRLKFTLDISMVFTI